MSTKKERKMAAALMSSKNPADRKRGAALLGQAKSPKKAEAARANGEKPKRKKDSKWKWFEKDPPWKFEVA